MRICDGKVVGMNQYEKEGSKVTYLQVIYKSLQKGYVGERACACRVSKDYKVGDKVRVLDDFRWPQVIEE